MQVNGHKISWPMVISIAAAGGSLVVWVGSIAGEGADIKRRVQTIEERQKEDRQEVRERLQRIEEKAQTTDKNVIEIKTLLEQMSRERRQR